jgi:Spy/CpxP family protein refolding chaperone
MNDDGSRTRRMRLLAIASLLLTFLAGGLVGTAVERARGARAWSPPPPGAEPGRGRGGPDIFEAGGPLDDRLRLTPRQRDTIQRIVQRDRQKADSLFREMRPRLRARFDSTRTAVEAVLTPQQREEFRRFREEHRERRRRRGGDRAAGSGPAPAGAERGGV